MIKGITGKNHYLDRLRRDVRRDWWLYAMLLPGLIYIIIFKYLPMYGVTIAFKNYSIFKGFEDSPWCGMDNFVKLFARPYEPFADAAFVIPGRIYCGNVYQH